MATAANPQTTEKDVGKPVSMGQNPQPGTKKPKPKPMIFTDFASI